MTPEEEVKKLNKLIRQYQTVYRTTPDSDQRERVEKELKALQSYRDKILAVNVIDGRELVEETEIVDDLAGYPVLKRLAAEDASRPLARAAAQSPDADIATTPSQREMHLLELYLGLFQREFLPFLTEKQLKLDFSFSMDRDAFYSKFQGLVRKVEEFREEHRRLAEGVVSREVEAEIRTRSFKLKRIIEAEAARFFRTLQLFCRELVEDAHGDGVKCLNGDAAIAFDSIEGARMLEGRVVRAALEELDSFASEVVSWLNVPEIEAQENERADRY